MGEWLQCEAVALGLDYLILVVDHLALAALHLGFHLCLDLLDGLSDAYGGSAYSPHQVMQGPPHSTPQQPR